MHGAGMKNGPKHENFNFLKMKDIISFDNLHIEKLNFHLYRA